MFSAYSYNEIENRCFDVTPQEAFRLNEGGKGSATFHCGECHQIVSPRFHNDGRAWHFMHLPCRPCIGQAATDLHQRVANIIANAAVQRKAICVPIYGNLRPIAASSEQAYYRVRPDVTVEFETDASFGRGRTIIFFEVTFTHGLGPEKKARLARYGVPVLEIDVSDLYGREIEELDLERIILSEISRKNWVILPYEARRKSTGARTLWLRACGWFKDSYRAMQAVRFNRPAQCELKLEGGAAQLPLRERRRALPRRRRGRSVQLSFNLG